MDISQDNADAPKLVRSYREASSARIATHPQLRQLMASALAVLARAGVRRNGAGPEGENQFDWSGVCANGAKLEIVCRGEHLPGQQSIPDETLRPADAAANVKWRAQYRLIVHAPILAFDIAWRENEPLRIMSFSRGSWEGDLHKAAKA